MSTVTVRLLDASGNLATSDNSVVTLSFGNNAGQGTLQNFTATAVNGVATFTNLSINKVGTGYTLKASASSLGQATVTSSTFDVITGPANHLKFATARQLHGRSDLHRDGVDRRSIREPDRDRQFLRHDGAGQWVSQRQSPGRHQDGASCGWCGHLQRPVDHQGRHRLHPGCHRRSLTGASSSIFSITASTADHLTITQQPSTTNVAGQAINTVVQVQDAFGNLVDTDSSTVTLTFGANPGSSTLGGTTTIQAQGGIATLAPTLNKVGTGYTLKASDGTLKSATTSTFSIVAAQAHHLGFSVQPANAVTGAVLTPAVKVQVLDAFGNLVTTNTSSVTGGPGRQSHQRYPSGTRTVQAVGGVATFSTSRSTRSGRVTSCPRPMAHWWLRPPMRSTSSTRTWSPTSRSRCLRPGRLSREQTSRSPCRP